MRREKEEEQIINFGLVMGISYQLSLVPQRVHLRFRKVLKRFEKEVSNDVWWFSIDGINRNIEYRYGEFYLNLDFERVKSLKIPFKVVEGILDAYDEKEKEEL